MTKQKFISFSLVLVVSMMLLGCSGTGGGGGGNANVSGTVVDLTFLPISNANVVIGSSTARTISNGTYTFTNISGGDQKIQITSAGHTSSYRRVTASGGQSVTAALAILADLDSKKTPIPVTGGTATNTNGSIKMAFTSGAFSAPQNVILTQVPKIAAPYPPPERNKFFSYVVYAYPEINLGGTGAVLSISNTLEVTSEAIEFYHFNPNSLAWELIGSMIETDATISMETTTMGWICAMIPNPTPGAIEGTVSNIGTSAPISGASIWTDNSSAVSDSSGHYILNYVPTGVATVTASAVSYAPYTSPPQTITPSHTTTLNIQLTSASLSQGSVSGTVRILGGSPTSIIPNARVVGSKGGVAYTDSNGMYTLYNIPTGSTIFTASALNYGSSTETATVIGNFTITGVDFSLPSTGTPTTYEFTSQASMEEFTTIPDSAGHNFWHVQYCDPNIANRLHDIFNSDHFILGGTIEVTRKVILPTDTLNGSIPTPYYTGSDYYFWYGETTTEGNPASSEGSYIGIEDPDEFTENSTGGTSYVGGTETTDGNFGSLISPPLDLTGYDNAELSFWTWWEIESRNPSLGYDSMNIYVSQSPYTTWVALGSLNPTQDPVDGASYEAYTSGGFNQPGQWVNQVFDLSAYVGKSIEIKFTFNTHDEQYNGFRGWFLDDIKIDNSQLSVSSSAVHRTTIPKVLPRNPR